MKWPNESERGLHKRPLWVLLCVLIACSREAAVPPESWDPVDIAVAEQGAAIAGCEDTGFANGTLTLQPDGDSMVLSAAGGKIVANGFVCTGMVQTMLQPLTTTNTAKIVIRGGTSDDTVIIDLLPGPFGGKILSNNGGITVDFATNDGGSDSFMLRGAATAETVRFASSTLTSEVYVDINSDKVADIVLKPGTNDMDLTASMGGGADTIIANPSATDFNTFAGARLSVKPLAIPLIAFGGVGDDKFTSGPSDDNFSGGEGNDTFRASAFPDGNDVYTGDQGVDTVDYSVRTAPLTIDIGPANVSRVGTEDLSAIDYAALAGKSLVFALDGGSNRSVTFTNPATPGDILAQINQVASATVATITAQNQLSLSTTTNTSSSSVNVDGASTSLGVLGLMSGLSATSPGTALVVDADDGEAGETDDVRSTVENITGGKGDDRLFGDGTKNTIKAGDGNDVVGGGSRACAGAGAADGDSLQGEAGDDVFYVPATNCFAVLTGGSGANTANFSGRSAGVSLSNNGMANDGTTDEKINVGTDILKLIGGFGNDTLAGAGGNDILFGGPGGDVLNGGAGAYDVVDYSTYTVATNVSVCFATSLAECGSANDGAGEGDQVYLVEHVIGGSAIDTFSVFNDVAVGVTFEGRGGDDRLTGGDGNDTLWGDDGADTLRGGKGDDTITGSAGIDVIEGGEGAGDICVSDGSDSPPATGCEFEG